MGPVLANAGQRGYFRVNYEADNWRALTDLLAQSGGGAEAVDAASRAQLYDDAFNLARAGIISYDVGFVPNTFLKNKNFFVAVARKTVVAAEVTGAEAKAATVASAAAGNLKKSSAGR